MNLTDLRRVTELAKLAECGITLTAAEAEWLLEGVEKMRNALDEVEFERDENKVRTCPWCGGIARINEQYHLKACPRQLALAHWSEP